MDTDYYSIDSILAEEEEVMCTLKVDAYNMQYLLQESDCDGASKEDSYLLAGTSMAFPFWLAKVLSKRKFTEMAPPQCFSKSRRAHVAASPWDVNFLANGISAPYYYYLGLQLLWLMNEDSAEPDNELHDLLKTTFMKRYKYILDEAQNTQSDLTQLRMKLTDFERQLFLAGYSSAVDYSRWKKQDTKTLKASSFIQKPKRTRGLRARTGVNNKSH